MREPTTEPYKVPLHTAQEPDDALRVAADWLMRQDHPELARNEVVGTTIWPFSPRLDLSDSHDTLFNCAYGRLAETMAEHGYITRNLSKRPGIEPGKFPDEHLLLHTALHDRIVGFSEEKGEGQRTLMRAAQAAVMLSLYLDEGSPSAEKRTLCEEALARELAKVAEQMPQTIIHTPPARPQTVNDKCTQLANEVGQLFHSSSAPNGGDGKNWRTLPEFSIAKGLPLKPELGFVWHYAYQGLCHTGYDVTPEAMLQARGDIMSHLDKMDSEQRRTFLHVMQDLAVIDRFIIHPEDFVHRVMPLEQSKLPMARDVRASELATALGFQPKDKKRQEHKLEMAEKTLLDKGKFTAI